MKIIKRNLSRGQSNLLTLISFSLMTVTPLMARDTVTGTLDLDGDGDGDPVANGSEFIVTGKGGSYTNKVIGASSLDSQWWASNQQITGYDDYVEGPDQGDFLTAHILDPIDPGSTFHVLKNYENGMTDYASNFRESSGNLPAGTNVYFGLSSYGSAVYGNDVVDPDKGGVANLTFVDNSGPSTYSVGQTIPYSWFHYTIDASSPGLQTVWQIDMDGLGYDAMTSWIAVFELPDSPGFTGIGAGTDWALSGFDDKGDFGSVTPGDEYYLDNTGDAGPVFQDDPTTDVLFSWTVDSKANSTDPTPDPEFGPDPQTVPEPTSFLLVGTGMMLIMFKRKR